MQLPPEHIMREMARLANEAAAEMFAKMADDMANDRRVEIATGPEALRIFAQAIRETNAKHYGCGGPTDA